MIVKWYILKVETNTSLDNLIICVLFVYCKLQLVQNTLTNIWYPALPPAYIYNILNKRNEEKVEELQLVKTKML
jgi:hypothetical protein